jgi:hypothetical protein
MITELTKAQADLMPVYVKKWRAIRDNTDRFTQKEAEDIVHKFQTEILKTAALPVVLFDNPLQLWKAVQEKFNTTVKFCSCYQDGSYFSYVFSYYDYFVEGLDMKFLTPTGEVDEELTNRWNIWRDTSKIGMIYPFDDVCFVTQKATKISYNERDQLHCENGPALAYAGGYEFYSLNGITVPEYLVMTPSEDLSLDFFKNEKNADVKAEFVRKYGVERMLDMGKKMDSFENYDQENHTWWWKSEYELWDMHVLFEGIEYQPYLKMRNCTTGIWHVEAVSPSCRTIADALKERFGNIEPDIVEIR